MEAISAHKERVPEIPENDLPMEIQQQLYSRFMHGYYEKWFSDRIPVLDGKTPVEAVKTKEGKLKVIELLKLYENGEGWNKQESRPHYDLAWVWKRLGIEKE